MWSTRKRKERESIDQVLKEIALQVEERKELFHEMKRIYKPENDRKYSNIFYFLSSEPELTKLAKTDIEDYQSKYNIKLPEIIVRLLTEIGSGKLINHTFLDREGALLEPLIGIEDEFLGRCIDAKIDPVFIEDELCGNYDFAKNQFEDEKVQAIYESLHSRRDDHLVVLFGVGGHDSYLTLNRDNNKELAVYNVYGISNKPFQVDGKEYESPYYKYCGDELNKAILHGINTHYWLYMLNEIKEMNV